MAPKKKASGKVGSSPANPKNNNKNKGKSRLPSEDGSTSMMDLDDGTSLSSLGEDSTREPSPALSVISTSGSEGNESLKEFYLLVDDNEDQQPPSLCKWVGCGDEFIDLQQLVDHVHQDHIGSSKSKYACDWEGCPRRGKLQNSRFSLLSHVRSHTGERPFTCPRPECDKSFTRSDAMAKHMRVQHGTAPNPARPLPTKKAATSGTTAGGGEGSDAEESGNVGGTSGSGGVEGTGNAAAPTLSSIWECESDLNTEYPVGSSSAQASRARNHTTTTRSSQRERSESTDNQNQTSSDPPIGHPHLATYPAGLGWVYEEIPPPMTSSQMKSANQEASDEAELTFWSTKGSQVEVLRSQVLLNSGATGAGGLPVDPNALSEVSGLTWEEFEKKEKKKRNTLFGTEGGMSEAIKLGFINPDDGDADEDEEIDSEIDEESKEIWSREDRKNAFEIGVLADTRQRWAESERSLRPKRRIELENQNGSGSKEDPTSRSTPSSLIPESTSNLPEDSSQASKRRKIDNGSEDTSSLGLFTNVPVDQGSSSSTSSSKVEPQDPTQIKSQEEEELNLMRKRHLVEKAKLKLVANERRRMGDELKELKKLRKQLRDGPEGTKEYLKSCLSMELGPNVQAIFSPPSSP